MKLFRITILTLLLCSFSLTGFSQTDGNTKKKKHKSKHATYVADYNNYDNPLGELAVRVIIDGLKIAIEAASKCHK